MLLELGRDCGHPHFQVLSSCSLYFDIHLPCWSSALLLPAGIQGKLSSGTFLAQAQAGIAAD